jgi:hypothetical protein
MKINKTLIESYARNLLGQVVAAAVIVSSTSSLSIFDFGGDQWKLVANALWASFVPVAIRYANKKDPAFGLVAEQATAAVSSKLTSRKRGGGKGAVAN